MATQAPLFDTHRTIEHLMTSGGFEKKQAEAIAEALDTALTGGIVTKADLKAEISSLENRLTIRMGVVVAFGVGLIGGFIAYATSLILSATAG